MKYQLAVPVVWLALSGLMLLTQAELIEIRITLIATASAAIVVTLVLAWARLRRAR